MKLTDRCNVRHSHRISVEFERDDAPGSRTSGYRNPRDVALLRISVEVDPNTGEVDDSHGYAVSVHTAVEIKKDGTPGARHATVGRLPYAQLPDEVREAVEARGREIAHEVTL